MEYEHQNVIKRLLHRARSSIYSRQKGLQHEKIEEENGSFDGSSQTYQRVVIDGDDGDKDFLKMSELIANIVMLREKYKAFDKQQQDDGRKVLFVDDEEVYNQTKRKSSEDMKKPSLTMWDPYKKVSFCRRKSSTNSISPSTSPDRDATGQLEMVEGVFHFYGQNKTIIPWTEYVEDIRKVYEAVENGPCLTTGRARLNTLQEKFELYTLLNTDIEENADTNRRGGGVFANCMKIDNSVHLRTCMDAAALVEYISDLATETPDILVSEVSNNKYNSQSGKNKNMSLSELLAIHGIDSPDQLTIDGLGLHPQRKKYHCFDAFDEKLNQAGKLGANILKAFLQHTGPNNGSIFANLVRPLLEKQEAGQKHLIATEMKIPLNGTHATEWAELADWIELQGLNTFTRNIWTIVISRSLSTRDDGRYQCDTNADQLRHIFYPMFMATLYPEKSKWANIALTLKKVGNINVISDEVTKIKGIFKTSHPPETIPWTENVNDYYFFYYVWANMRSLNALRQRRGLNLFQFTPTCSWACGHLDQLVSSYLLADSIHGGTKLIQCWILQYLYMFHQIGIVMSMFADNMMHMDYFDNPFPTFFKRGLRVCVATRDPLHYHHSPNALIEELGTAMKIYKLSAMDMCEIARNSCLVSNFPHEFKVAWLGSEYTSVFEGNDSSKTNICDFRLHFRHECLMHEQDIINLMLKKSSKKETPQQISVIPKRMKSTTAGEIEWQRRNLKRINYMDRKIKYPRIDIFDSQTVSHSKFRSAGEALQQVVNIRQSYSNKFFSDVAVEDVFKQTKFDESIWEYNSYYGVFLLSRIGRPPSWPQYIPPIARFIQDVSHIRQVVVGNREVVRLATHRLELLEHKFKLHLGMNISREAGNKEEKETNNRDIFTSIKVDNNVHTDSGMNSRTLLDFFSEKAINNGHDIVLEENNELITLRQLLDRLHINPNRIAVDELHNLVQKNPQIRSIFLETDNFMQGRYFAELINKTLEIYKLDEFTFSENRLVIRGSDVGEWHNLAMWFDRNGMASSQNRWIVCLPRSYRKLKQQGAVRNFAQFLDNIFQPLWEVSLLPAQDPKFHYFLNHVSGIDCVGDESKMDLPLTAMAPHDWSTDLNPPYNYYIYYYWANIVSLNHFRASRGLSTLEFRPQCGEFGGVDHLIGGFLLANSINQGVTLRSYPAMEYLYFLTQLGIAMSPLANTANSVLYTENPFLRFFSRGLKVSLATNQPLFYHFTREPLIEEYSIASKIWKLEFNDLCEVARNSVIISGFSPGWKENALGKLYYLHSTLGNDVDRSKVSDIRVAYRFEVYHTELNFLDELLTTPGVLFPRAMQLLEHEVDTYEKVTGTTVKMADFDDTQLSSVDGPPKKKIQVETEVEDINSEILKLKNEAQQLAEENLKIANKIKNIRIGLKEEPLAIQANLANNENEKPFEGDDECSDNAES